MKSLEECKKIFKNKFPNLTITNVVDLDKNSYVFTALLNPNKVNDNDPFYMINKNTGKISEYNPILDLERYSNALYNS